MKEVRYFCEDCDMYFDNTEELEVMEVIGGYHNIMCCPECRGPIEITVTKQNNFLLCRRLVYELDKKQVKALYDFAEMFNTEDIRIMVDNRLDDNQLKEFNNVLDTIYKSFQEKNL